MLSLNWGTFFRAIRDWRNNTPLSKPTVSGTTVLQDLQNFELLLPQIKAWLAAHPGSITAADDILNTLPYTWAKELDSSITGLPDVVSAISEWLQAVWMQVLIP